MFPSLSSLSFYLKHATGVPHPGLPSLSGTASYLLHAPCDTSSRCSIVCYVLPITFHVLQEVHHPGFLVCISIPRTFQVLQEVPHPGVPLSVKPCLLTVTCYSSVGISSRCPQVCLALLLPVSCYRRYLIQVLPSLLSPASYLSRATGGNSAWFSMTCLAPPLTCHLLQEVSQPGVS